MENSWCCADSVSPDTDPAAARKEIELARAALAKSMSDLEGKEKLIDRKKRRLSLENKELGLDGEEFLNQVKLRANELDGQLLVALNQARRLEEAHNEVRKLRRRLCDKLKDIKSQEQNLKLDRVEADERENKLAMVIDTLDGRITAVENREAAIDLLLKKNLSELTLKEEQLKKKGEKFISEVKHAEEKIMEKFEKEKKIFSEFLDKTMEEVMLKEETLCNKWAHIVKNSEQAQGMFKRHQNSTHSCLKRLEKAESRLETVKKTLEERLMEMEFGQNVGWESFREIIAEAELIRESTENLLNELEKMKQELNSSYEDKKAKLSLKEQLKLMYEQLLEEADSRDENMIKQENLLNQLLQKSESKLDQVEGLWESVRQRYDNIVSKESQVNALCEWVEKKMDEADSKEIELRKREEMTMMKEETNKSKEDQLALREHELGMKETSLLSQEIRQRELDEHYKQQRADLEWQRKNLDSVKEFLGKHFKDHLAIKEEALSNRKLVEKLSADLKHTKQQLESKTVDQKSQQRETRDHQSLEINTSPDIKFVVTMDGKTLQMFLNDCKNDVRSMGDEIITVLGLSSDPAKIVLDAIAGFFPPHLRKEDSEFSVRQTCIILLNQLFKMSPKITPKVKEEAAELAHEWKSKMGMDTENVFEIFGILNLLAAYGIASCFDEKEVLSFLRKVHQCKNATILYQDLGLSLVFDRVTEELKHGR